MLSDKRFDVEHALNMHAASFFYMPAAGIYDRERLEPHAELIAKCHIYLIGFVPRVNFVNAAQKDRDLVLTYEILGKSYDLVWELPPEAMLHHENGLWYVGDGTGRRFFPNEGACLQRLNHQYGVIKFLVKYIGQAYGQDGSRSALDRLIKHETLQKISLLGAPEGYRLELILLQVEPDNQIITIFNPFAENKKDGSARIDQGLEKLFNTSEEERVALYEAAMIRYFSPEFNMEYKNSFPSTTLKILQDCYDKDFSAVSAELVLDDLPVTLYSEAVTPTDMHFAFHDLHTDEARKVFFAM
ncbi:hypothetical protein CSC94_11880 [Zhengella mangrovi]|uniref:Uncharacterized protein n=1 Tax=Zhengella mangrovi TaxID=1982044 RepID=A0A2G1QN78_9HYPH|nr:hypothetical protein CSC94_11880 [Zhengella mangrovi]